MKILHTADWHIGKMLHKQSLADEMKMFIDWLLDYIKEENIDLLLISGDVFDVANPSSRDRAVYFQFLSRVNQIGVRTIITGGNHDAVAVLNAPAQLLDHMGITVIGGATNPITDEVIEIKDKQGALIALVAAVPFLRDRDLRSINQNPGLDRREAIREGMKEHYGALAEHCKEHKGKVPILGMGHLYAKGASVSESERDIGNQSGISADIFTEVFDYVALGHIHRPQIVAKNECIRYSGSPIALSFSEKADEKSFLVIKTKGAKIKEVQTVPIPKQRSLVRIAGDYEKVKAQLAKYKSEKTLQDFIEVQVKAPTFSHSLIMEVEEMISGYKDQDQFTILKHSFDFAENAKNINEFFGDDINIEEMKPSDIFDTKLVSEEGLEEEQKTQLRSLFQEVLIDVQQND